MKCFIHSDGCCSPVTDCCCLQTVRKHHKEKSLSSMETQLSNQESTTDWLGLTAQSFMANVLLSSNLSNEQKRALWDWLPSPNSKESLAIAEATQKATLDAIMDAYARDCLSMEKIGPQSLSEKDSRNPTTAKWDGALVDETGAIKYPEENRGKLTTELSDCQLHNEYNYWAGKVKNASGWGAALSQANECKIECEKEMKRRELNTAHPVPLMKTKTRMISCVWHHKTDIAY